MERACMLRETHRPRRDVRIGISLPLLVLSLLKPTDMAIATGKLPVDVAGWGWQDASREGVMKSRKRLTVVGAVSSVQKAAE